MPPKRAALLRSGSYRLPKRLASANGEIKEKESRPFLACFIRLPKLDIRAHLGSAPFIALTLTACGPVPIRICGAIVHLLPRASRPLTRAFRAHFAGLRCLATTVELR